MTDLQEPQLPAGLDDVVRHAEGVSTVFRAGGAFTKMRDAGAKLLGLRDEDSLVRVESSADGAVIDAAIGVSTGSRAEDVARRVHAAIDAACVAQGIQAAEIRVTVMQVEGAA